MMARPSIVSTSISSSRRSVGGLSGPFTLPQTSLAMNMCEFHATEAAEFTAEKETIDADTITRP